MHHDLGYIRHKSTCCTTPVRKIAYESYSWPQMKYVASTWNPHQSYLVNYIESTQNRSARFNLSEYSRTFSIGWHAILFPAFVSSAKYFTAALISQSLCLLVPIEYPPAIPALLSVFQGALFQIKPLHFTENGGRERVKMPEGLAWEVPKTS